MAPQGFYWDYWKLHKQKDRLSKEKTRKLFWRSKDIDEIQRVVRNRISDSQQSNNEQSDTSIQADSVIKVTSLNQKNINKKKSILWETFNEELDKIRREQQLFNNFNSQEIDNFLNSTPQWETLEQATIFFRLISKIVCGQASEAYTRIAKIPWQERAPNLKLIGWEQEHARVCDAIQSYNWSIDTTNPSLEAAIYSDDVSKVWSFMKDIQTQKKLQCDYIISNDDISIKILSQSKTVLHITINEKWIHTNFDFWYELSNNDDFNGKLQKAHSWEEQLHIIQEWLFLRFGIKFSNPPVFLPNNTETKKTLKKIEAIAPKKLNFQEVYEWNTDYFVKSFPKKWELRYLHAGLNKRFYTKYLANADKEYIEKRRILSIQYLLSWSDSLDQVITLIWKKNLQWSVRLKKIIALITDLLKILDQQSVHIGDFDAKIITLAEEVDAINILVYTSANNRFSPLHEGLKTQHTGINILSIKRMLDELIEIHNKGK